MGITERILDTRHCAEGKVAASVLAALLVFSTVTPSALAFADTPAVEGSVARVDANASTSEIAVRVEAEHADVFFEGQSVVEGFKATADKELSFAVRAHDGACVNEVLFNGEALEPAGTQRAISTEPGSEGQESVSWLYVVPPEKLSPEATLNVTASVESEEMPASGDETPASATEAGSLDASEPSQKAASANTVMQKVIVQGVSAMASSAVETVKTPIMVVQASDESVVTVDADVYQGATKLGDRSIALPADGTAVKASSVLPVTEPVFNFGANSYVLNGKVAVVAVDATREALLAASKACDGANDNVTAFRVREGVVEYTRGASESWSPLEGGMQLVYFCSMLQNSGEDKDKLNVAVEEPVIEEAADDARILEVVAFDAESEQVVFRKTMAFAADLDVLSGGIHFGLGDGVNYAVVASHLLNHTDDKARRPLSDEEALALAKGGLGADRYTDGAPISWGDNCYCTIALTLAPRSYAVSYDGNGATAGSVPETEAFVAGQSNQVLVKAPDGLTKDGYRFVGWKAVDVSGYSLGVYQPSQQFSMPSCDVALVAQWEPFDGVLFYYARYVWKDEEGVEKELKKIQVKEKKDGEGGGAALALGDTLAADAADCPEGYDCSASETCSFTHVGQVCTFYVTRNNYEVTTTYHYNGVIGSQTKIANAPFGTVIHTNAAASEDTNRGSESEPTRHYILERVDPADFVVTANASANQIHVYYVTDELGGADGAKGDGIPDKYQATVTFTHDDQSVWADGSEEEGKQAVVTLYKDGEYATADEGGVGYLTEAQIPALKVADGLMVDDRSWASPEVPITTDVTFHAKFGTGSYPYEVRYVDERGNEILEGEKGETLHGEPLLRADFEAPVIEGYAFDAIENADGTVTSDAAKNVVTVKYGTDAMGATDPEQADGIPDKYQAKLTYVIKNGHWIDALESTSKDVVVTLNDRENGWAPLDAPDFQLPVASAKAGYQNAGTWAPTPTVEAVKEGLAEFVFSCAPMSYPYTINYYQDSMQGRRLGSVSGTAPFDGPVPVEIERYRPFRGYDLAPTFDGPTVMQQGANVLNVVFNRETFSVSVTVDSHGILEGEALQTVAYGANSKPVTITADEGYRIASVVVNGESQVIGNGQTSYTMQIRRVSADATVGVKTVPMGAIAIEAPSLSKIYDGTPLQAASVLVSGVPDGYTVAARATGELTDAGATVAAVEPTSIKITDDAGVDVTDNFQVETIEGTLKVEKAPVRITVNSARKTVGTEDPAFSGSVAGVVAGESLGEVVYSRTLKGESAGVYVDAITADFPYNSNYDVKVIPGTFTIEAPTLVPPTGTDGAAGTPRTPLPRAGRAVVEFAAGATSAAQTLVSETAVAASAVGSDEPVYGEVVFDDETPMVSRSGEAIEDDLTALGAFDEPHCWVHWAMLIGIVLTLGYAIAVVARRLGYARSIDDFDQRLTGVVATEEPRAARAAHKA